MIVIFGDFNIDTISDCRSKSDHEKLLYTLNFKQQRVQQTRGTATSITCLDRFITSFQMQTQVIPTTTKIRDHFSVLGEIPLSSDENENPHFEKQKIFVE